MTLTSVSAAETARPAVTDAADWIAGLAWLQAHIALHPGIRLPKPGTLRVEVAAGSLAEREADLREIGRQWDGDVTAGEGALVMRRWFGRFVCVTALIRYPSADLAA
jgi:hypothetical protein